MEPDKRRFARKRTDQLLYAELGPDNGSILLNLCEDGCSFQSIAPVREQNVRFTVSVGDGRKLEGDGRMIWSDTAKKTGGLRFLNPSQALKDQVREWLNQTLVMADGQLDPAAVESQAKLRRKQLREAARLEAERMRKETERKASADASEQRQRPAWSPQASPAEATNHVILSGGTDAFAQARRRESSGRTWWGLGTLALVAVLFLGLISYRRELGHLVMWFGSSLAGEQHRDEGNSAPAEKSPASNIPASSGVVEDKPAALSDQPDTRESGLEAGPPSNNQVAQPVAQTELPKRSAIGSTTEDIVSLWSAVENGDTHAEVTLASRYVRGDGVPQSCAQARVLLEAAIKRGSAEALQRLEQLAQAGCP